MSNVKELVVIMRQAEEQGFEVVRTNGGHYRWTAPSGRFMFTSQTPSDVRALHRIRSDLRRLGFIEIKTKKSRRK